MIKPKKTSLSIRLAESAVFLRSDDNHSRSNDRSTILPSRDSLLRGLLVLDLAKPTRITNIEVQLIANSTISCTEGAGPRRLEVSEHHHIFHSSTILFRSSAPETASSASHRRSVSIGPGISYNQSVHPSPTISRSEADDHNDVEYTPSQTTNYSTRRPKPSPSPIRIRNIVSRDVSTLGRNQHTNRRDHLVTSTPSPPYFKLTAEEHLSSATLNQSSSSVGRRPSFTDAILEDEVIQSSNDQLHARSVTEQVGSSLHLPASGTTDSVASLDRGRLHARTPLAPLFSLSTVPSILIGAVGSAFPPNNDNDDSLADGSSQSTVNLVRGRGRTTERYEGSHQLVLKGGEYSRSRETGIKEEKEGTSLLAKLLGEREECSQEFKPGTYTYPITFRIPSSAPPTLQADYGCVYWKLKACVHRPGTFHSKLSAEREVIVVTSPTEEDTEASESIVIERNWDQQLQYIISISGRAFFIGGAIPISIVLMPMDKVKVHRITAYIEEKVEYFSHSQRLVRTDSPVRVPLLSLRNEKSKNSVPILPLETSSTDVLRSSPLFELLDPEERRSARKLDELAASFMGPGPWSFSKDLKLPNCKLMKFSNKNLKANLKIGHLLKIILRVEKASVPAEGETPKAKPSLFDIVVQTPVLILSCRCNPKWASLPTYTEIFEDVVHNITPACPCQVRREPALPFPRTSTESLLAAPGNFSAPPTAWSPPPETRLSRSLHSEYSESIIRSSSLFERLVSGQESETGEAPPAYDCDSLGGDGPSSISVAVREVPPKVAKKQASGIFIWDN